MKDINFEPAGLLKIVLMVTPLIKFDIISYIHRLKVMIEFAVALAVGV